MSGSKRTIRRRPVRAAVHHAAYPVILGLTGLALLVGPVTGQTGEWDCRVAPDGRDWQCLGGAGPDRERPDAADPATPWAGSTVDDDEVRPPDRRAKPTPIAPAPIPPGATPEAPARPLRETPPMQPTPTPPPGPEAAAGVTAVAAIDAGIDWDRCRAGDRAGTPEITLGDSTGPISVSADAAVAELAPERLRFSGDVRLVQGDQRLQADELVLDRRRGEIDARGNLLLSRPDVRVAGSTAHYRLDRRQGSIEQASYRVPTIQARGDAAQAEFLGQGLSRYRDITYSTCRPGRDDWLLRAETLELDQVEGLGSARHATLSFFDLPLLYAPTFTFPIDDRRRSGVLVPTLGHGGNTGVDISVPYYFNLAPNYDLTLTPRLMSKRGLMLGGEFRYLTPRSAGRLVAEYLPDDREYDGGSSDRGSASLRSSLLISPRSHASVLLNYVSDSDYLEDLGSSLAATSATHVLRRGTLNYHGESWDLRGRVQYYQTLDDAIPTAGRPYSLLPQLRFGLERPDGIGGTTYHLDGDYANFYRKDSVRGHRLDLFPALSLPLSRPWGFIESKAGARYTAYRLTDQVAGRDDQPSHLTGLLSLDSGLYFDRTGNFLGHRATHTLEPRLYYLYVPSSAQDDQPIFDTTGLDFSFDNLFRENRFSGPDRMADANQLTLALTSRMIADDSGRELLRASLGQILFFEDRDVGLPGEAVTEDSSSAVIAEIAAQLGGGWTTRAGLQWDPHDGSSGTVDQALAQVSFRDTDRRVFNAAYRLRNGVIQQTDVAVVWPINERLSLIGRHNYSLDDSRVLETLAGVEYGRCCWRLRALARQYTDSTGDDHNLAFLVQLELNGLGRLGSDIDQTLERSIYGYQNE